MKKYVLNAKKNNGMLKQSHQDSAGFIYTCDKPKCYDCCMKYCSNRVQLYKKFKENVKKAQDLIQNRFSNQERFSI